MNRLFVAIPLPQEVLQKIFQIRKNIPIADSELKWEKPEKIHITLKFIGEVPDEIIPLIIEKISFLENYEKISLSLSEFNFFPNGNNPKILYIRLSNNEIINQIVFELNKRLFELGLAKADKKFNPHLTLLRIKKQLSATFINDFRSFQISAINFMIEEISLFKSKLTQNGSRYNKIKKYNLR